MALDSSLHTRVIDAVEGNLADSHPILKGTRELREAAVRQVNHACDAVREMIRESIKTSKALLAQRSSLERQVLHGRLRPNDRFFQSVLESNAKLRGRATDDARAYITSVIEILCLDDALRQELIAALYAENF